MGRRKIDIRYIEDERNRQVTFTKRRNGLLKKARELSILCGAEIAVVIFSSVAGQTRLHDYSSHNITKTLSRLSQFEGTVESRDNNTYNSQVPAQTQSRTHDDPRAQHTLTAAGAARATIRRQRINLPHDQGSNMIGIPSSNLVPSNSHPFGIPLLQSSSELNGAQPAHDDDDDDEDDEDDGRDSRDPADVRHLSNSRPHHSHPNGNFKSINTNDTSSVNGPASLSVTTAPGTTLLNSRQLSSTDQLSWIPKPHTSVPLCHGMNTVVSNLRPQMQGSNVHQDLTKKEPQPAKLEQVVALPEVPPSSRRPFPQLKIHISDSGRNQPDASRPQPLEPHAQPPANTPQPSPRPFSTTGQGSHQLRNSRPLTPREVPLPSPKAMYDRLDRLSSTDPTRFVSSNQVQHNSRLPNSTNNVPPPAKKPRIARQQHFPGLTIDIPRLQTTDPLCPDSARRRSNQDVKALPSGSAINVSGGWSIFTTPFTPTQMPMTCGMPTPTTESLPTLMQTPHGDLTDPLETPKTSTARSSHPSASSAFPLASPNTAGPIVTRNVTAIPATPTGGLHVGNTSGQRTSPGHLEMPEGHGPPSARSRMADDF